MRSALLASVLTACVMWLALGNNPARSQTEAKPATCQSCGKGAGCPCCAAGKACPHCKGHPGHGWHGPHQFEYKCVHQSERANKKAADAMSAQFNGLGESGWRLAKADAGFWCFIRPRSEQ